MADYKTRSTNPASAPYEEIKAFRDEFGLAPVDIDKLEHKPGKKTRNQVTTLALRYIFE